MHSKAQAGLEYLMTYGWALILVATIITVLVFVVGKPGPSVAFNVSDPTKFLLKSAGVSGNTAGIVLQNATGGRMTIKSITFNGDLLLKGTSKLNGQAFSTPADILAGGEIRLEELKASNNGANSRIIIKYTDIHSFDRELVVASGQGAPAGIAAAYSLEGDAVDGSGNKNAGTVNGATTASGCASGSCLSFNNNYVEIPSCGSPPCTCSPPNSLFCIGSEGVTYMAWIKASSFNPTHNMIMGQYLPYFGVYGPGNKLRFSLQAGTTVAQRSLDGLTALNATNWYHVAATYDSAGYMKVFLNGKQDCNPIGPFTPITNYPAYPVRVGVWLPTAGSQYWFNGLIDEVQIFDRALSESEICSECKRFAGGPAGVTCNC